MCDPSRAKGGGNDTHPVARLRPEKASVPAVQVPDAAILPRPSAVGAAADAGHHGGRAEALLPRRAPAAGVQRKSPLPTPLAPPLRVGYAHGAKASSLVWSKAKNYPRQRSVGNNCPRSIVFRTSGLQSIS